MPTSYWHRLGHQVVKRMPAMLAALPAPLACDWQLRPLAHGCNPW